MADLRRALLFASGGRYVVMAVNLASATVLARLLTPAEFGVSVLGASLLSMAEAVRELGSVAYLVQQKDLTQGKIRTVFTISLIVTSIMTIVLVTSVGVFRSVLSDTGTGPLHRDHRHQLRDRAVCSSDLCRVEPRYGVWQAGDARHADHADERAGFCHPCSSGLRLSRSCLGDGYFRGHMDTARPLCETRFFSLSPFTG